MSHRSVLAAQILWPSFLAAAVLEMLVFSVVDPAHVVVGNWSPEANTVYSLAFLAFWAVASGAATLSHWMRRAPKSLSTQRRSKRARRDMPLSRHAHG